MPTSINVTNLKINTLTEAQYDTAVQNNVIGANELSIITDLDTTIQVSTIPTASATEEGNIYQYVGTTDANYTNGYFYKCVSDGGNPATYSWSNIQVQAGGGLPSQTGQSGKFLTTDGTDASWGNAVSSTSVTIATTDWSSNTASVTVSGLTATSVVWVAPDNASQSAYLDAGVYASSQTTDTLTFTCTQTPASALTITVVFC